MVRRERISAHKGAHRALAIHPTCPPRLFNNLHPEEKIKTQVTSTAQKLNRIGFLADLRAGSKKGKKTERATGETGARKPLLQAVEDLRSLSKRCRRENLVYPPNTVWRQIVHPMKTDCPNA